MAYVHLGVTPAIAPLLSGLNAAVVGLVASITLKMVRSSIARPWQMGVAAAALLFAVGGGAGAGEIAALGIASGLVVDLGTKRFRLARLRRRAAAPAPPVAVPEEGAPLPDRHPNRSGPGGGAAAGAFLSSFSGLGTAGALASMALVLARAGLGA